MKYLRIKIKIDLKLNEQISNFKNQDKNWLKVEWTNYDQTWPKVYGQSKTLVLVYRLKTKLNDCIFSNKLFALHLYSEFDHRLQLI